MQVLYVVEFDVAAARNTGAGPQNAYHEAVTALSDWLNYSASEKVESTDFATSGSRALRPNFQGHPRSAEWEFTGAGPRHALRTEIRDNDDDANGQFVTRVTLGDIDGRVSARVSMARESSPVWLSPVAPADLRQPGIVRNLLASEKIALTIKSQVQDGRYLQIRSDDQVDQLVEAIGLESRLPLVLIHTRTLPALAAARTAASKLVGLARVVTLDYRASRRLEDLAPGHAPPRAGARLIWSDASAPSVAFDEYRVNGEDEDWLRAQLMRQLAPASVLSRGTDLAFQSARTTEIAEQQTVARARADQAAATGNKDAQIDALKAELDASQQVAREWEQLAVVEEERATRFESEAAKSAGLRAQVEQLNEALVASLQGMQPKEDANDPWDNLPALMTGDEDSAQDLFLQLEDAASSRIVFSDRAASSWKKSRYPFPEEMSEALVTLARVGDALYDGSERTMPRLDNWVWENFGLKVSLADDTIERDGKLRNFVHDGQTHDRTPHVKVRDHAPHSQVGRIHFALDTDGQRLIVDHVGIKLY